MVGFFVMKQRVQKKLLNIYDLLFNHFGPQHWWPGDTRLEICVGAILTQNTAWANVEKALSNLKKEKYLNQNRLKKIGIKKLAALIKPSGYFNIKAKRLKSFIDYFSNHHKGNFDSLFAGKSGDVRDSLLSIYGIGPETADSFMLYAGEIPVFVVDAYTRRIFSRLRMIEESLIYDEVQSFFMNNLPCDKGLFNEYHALIVMLGKNYCKPKPNCDLCPLKRCPSRETKKS